MHIFFSGIGGTAIGPLALIAHQAGFTVSGSDMVDSSNIKFLLDKGLTNIHIGQSKEKISKVHEENTIDWFVASSAIAISNPDAEELVFCRENNIKISKRDELLNYIITENNLDLIAISGTHGKTTTTSMVVWLMQELGIPLSYSVGTKLLWADDGHFDPTAKYFVLEADEYDRNFLSYHPRLSVISGISWDHQDVYPKRDDYKKAFRQFIDQSDQTVVWKEDLEYLGLTADKDKNSLGQETTEISEITLPGIYNRLDGWLAIEAVSMLTKKPTDELRQILNNFPGIKQRMEKISPNLYSDYAHTPEKIKGAMSVAKEMFPDQKIVIIYEPHSNRRQIHMIDKYNDSFDGAEKIYWLPNYIVRSDDQSKTITPDQLIERLSDPSIAEPAQMDDELEQNIREHLSAGDVVIGMTAGPLDPWLRQNF